MTNGSNLIKLNDNITPILGNLMHDKHSGKKLYFTSNRKELMEGWTFGSPKDSQETGPAKKPGSCY